MTLLGLKWRLKVALWKLFDDSFWDSWNVHYSKDESFLTQYHSERRAKILSIPPQFRQVIKDLDDMDAKYLIRKNTAIDKVNRSVIHRTRIFQVLKHKQEIELYERQLAEEMELKNKLERKRSPIA